MVLINAAYISLAIYSTISLFETAVEPSAFHQRAEEKHYLGAKGNRADLITLTVTGSGTNPREAREDVIRSALQEALPQIVIARREIYGDVLLLDSIISSLTGFIESYQVVETVEREGVFFETAIVGISSHRIAGYIESFNLPTGETSDLDQFLAVRNAAVGNFSAAETGVSLTAQASEDVAFELFLEYIDRFSPSEYSLSYSGAELDLIYIDSVGSIDQSFFSYAADILTTAGFNRVRPLDVLRRFNDANVEYDETRSRGRPSQIQGNYLSVCFVEFLHPVYSPRFAHLPNSRRQSHLRHYEHVQSTYNRLADCYEMQIQDANIFAEYASLISYSNFTTSSPWTNSRQDQVEYFRFPLFVNHQTSDQTSGAIISGRAGTLMQSSGNPIFSQNLIQQMSRVSNRAPQEHAFGGTREYNARTSGGLNSATLLDNNPQHTLYIEPFAVLSGVRSNRANRITIFMRKSPLHLRNAYPAAGIQQGMRLLHQPHHFDLSGTVVVFDRSTERFRPIANSSLNNHVEASGSKTE